MKQIIITQRLQNRFRAGYIPDPCTFLEGNGGYRQKLIFERLTAHIAKTDEFMSFSSEGNSSSSSEWFGSQTWAVMDQNIYIASLSHQLSVFGKCDYAKLPLWSQLLTSFLLRLFLFSSFFASLSIATPARNPLSNL